VGKACEGHFDQPLKICPDLLLDISKSLFFERLPDSGTCIVDENIDCSKRLNNGINSGCYAFIAPEVQLYKRSISGPELPASFFRLLTVCSVCTIGQDNLCLFIGKGEGSLTADSVTRPCYENNPVFDAVNSLLLWTLFLNSSIITK
jgi:hypothetical protein